MKKLSVYLVLTVLLCCVASAVTLSHRDSFNEKVGGASADVNTELAYKIVSRVTQVQHDDIRLVLNDPAYDSVVESYLHSPTLEMTVELNTEQDSKFVMNVYGSAGESTNYSKNISYTYKRWIYGNPTGDVDWANERLQKEFKTANKYDTKDLSLAMTQQFIERNYVYYFSKSSVCSDQVKSILNEKDLYFANPEFVKSSECRSWDKNWVRDSDLGISVPSFAFSDQTHYYPDNVNFGEPPILLTMCWVKPFWYYDDGGADPDINNYFTQKNKYSGEIISFSSDSSKSFLSGYYLSNSEGATYGSHTFRLGNLLPYIPGHTVNDSKVYVHVLLSCELAINTHYRHKSPLDTTATFSTFFPSHPVLSRMNASRVVLEAVLIGSEVNGSLSFRKDGAYFKNNLTYIRSGSEGDNFVYDFVNGSNESNPYVVPGVGSVSGTAQILSQENLNTELGIMQKKGAVFDFLLLVVDIIVSILIILSYFVEIAIIIFILFVAVPGIFKMMIKNFKELTR